MTTGWCERIRAQSSWFAPLGAAEWQEASEARRAALGARLANPPLSLTAAELAGLFEIDWVTIVARSPEGLQDYPELAVRVRGALGRVLKGFGPPILDRRDPAARPAAYGILFEPPIEGARVEIAKPLVVHAEVSRGLLRVRLGLVGMAGFWRPDAAAALLGALEGGVALWEEGRLKAPIECLSASHERTPGFEPPIFPVREARLSFCTPFRLRAGDALVPSGASLLIAIANRVARIAPWQLARLSLDWRQIHEQAHRLDVQTGDLLPYGWTRGTQRARRRLPMAGFLGPLVVRGRLDDFVPLLQITAAVNVGSQAALGLGRFDLALLP